MTTSIQCRRMFGTALRIGGISSRRFLHIIRVRYVDAVAERGKPETACWEFCTVTPVRIALPRRPELI